MVIIYVNLDVVFVILKSVVNFSSEKLPHGTHLPPTLLAWVPGRFRDALKSKIFIQIGSIDILKFLTVCYRVSLS